VDVIFSLEVKLGMGFGSIQELRNCHVCLQILLAIRVLLDFYVFSYFFLGSLAELYLSLWDF